MSDNPEEEICISMFDYTHILPHHSVLIVESDPERAAALINCILRKVSNHLKSSPAYEQGEIFTECPTARFRFPKRVHPYEKKQFPAKMADIFSRQAFSYSFATPEDDPNTWPLHFLPQNVASQHPALQHLSDKQYLRLNKLMRIPRAFLVLHHCFAKQKQFPRNEHLLKMISEHNIHHRLLFILSCPVTQTIPTDLCNQFDWIFYFDHTESQWKRWYRMAFQRFFANSKIFLHFMNMTQASQGVVMYHPYEYPQIGTHLRRSLDSQLKPLDKEHSIQQACLAITKRLRFMRFSPEKPHEKPQTGP
jgi:hypothetical protein